jgi:hypothetical protein
VVAASAALASPEMGLTTSHSSTADTGESMKTIITSSLGYASATQVGIPGEVSPQTTGIKPKNASGCTGGPPGLSGEYGFCISVSGSGTHVNWIRTSAYAYNDGCSVAQFLRNGIVIMPIPQVPNTVLCIPASIGEQQEQCSAPSLTFIALVGSTSAILHAHAAMKTRTTLSHSAERNLDPSPTGASSNLDK